MDPITITRSITIAAPVQRVWRAVTEPVELERWYAPGRPWEIPDLAAGATVRFHNTPDEILAATISVLDPPHEFSLRWQASPAEPALDMTTRFKLEAAEGGTRLTIHETGFHTLAGGAGPAHAEQAAAGYEASLAALKALLEGVPA